MIVFERSLVTLPPASRVPLSIGLRSPAVHGVEGVDGLDGDRALAVRVLGA